MNKFIEIKNQLPLTTKSRNTKFDRIEKNSIYYRKNGMKETRIINNTQILEDTLVIGQIVQKKHIMTELKRTNRTDLLNMLKGKFSFNNPNISNGDLKILIREQLNIMDTILKEMETDKDIDIDNQKELNKLMPPNDKFYKLIENWFNNYGYFIEDNEEDFNYMNLYYFLEKCEEIYLDFIEEKDIKIVIEIVGKVNDEPSYRYKSVFDYIKRAMQNCRNECVGIKECEICGKVFIGRKDAKTCGPTCRSRKHRSEKKDWSDSNDNSIKE